jgi:hypothetical protein
VPGALAGTRAPGPVALPTPAQVRADMQRMVDLGSRYTGTSGHAKFIDWLEEELVAAGCVMRPRQSFDLTVWEAQRYGLDLLDGDGKGPVKVAAYYPRSQETGDAGVSGRLVYAGVPPVPSISPDLESLLAGFGNYPRQITSWVQGLLGTAAGPLKGSILLVDVPMPLPLTLAPFLALSTYQHWTGHNISDFAGTDFKRAALTPGVVAMPVAPFAALGAAGVVFILDASYEAIASQYFPFENAFEDIPALYVDRDTGTRLRALAGSRPRARLTLTATRHKGSSPALMGYIPGRTDESIFIDTHTDGEGFAEENGGVGIVQLARHYGSLPVEQRPKRTLVFSLWPGHMASGMPQLQGIVDRNPEVIHGAVAGITVEHLGCSEWIDTADKGYHPTGDPEPFLVWTTQGKVFELTRDATIAQDLPRTMLMRPPVQFGVGSALQGAGIPQIGFLAGPYYLLEDTGSLQRFDEQLAAKQIAWVADLIARLDVVPAADLATGDITLGSRTTGVRASYPAPPALELSLSVGATTSARLLRNNALHGRVSLNRIGLVRVHARIEQTRSGRGVTTTLVDQLVHVPAPGVVPLKLALTKRGRAALRHHGRTRLVVTVRFRERGVATVRTARRKLA